MMNQTINKAVILTGFLFAHLGFLKAQPYDYTSNDNTSPSAQNWELETTWTIFNDEGWLPRTPGYPSTHSNVYGIDIYGYTFRNGDLNSTNANPEYQIHDTLFVDGNMTLGSGASMNIASNGLLIVKGNLWLEGSFQLTSGGTMVVTGDVTVTNGHIQSTGDFYVYGTTNVTNGGGIGNGGSLCYPWDPCNPEDYSKTETELSNDDPVLYDFVDTGINGNTVLPITLYSFAVKKKDHSAQLSWLTSKEENFDYFSVEHSSDGKNFTEIDKVFGAGNSHVMHTYGFSHNHPKTGWNYYRLTAVDVDGTSETFKAASVYIEPGNESSKVYPNPGNGQHLQISSTDFPGGYELTIRNMEGKIVHQSTPDSYSTSIQFEKHLEKGMYIVELKNADHVKSHKYLVR